MPQYRSRRSGFEVIITEFPPSLLAALDEWRSKESVRRYRETGERVLIGREAAIHALVGMALSGGQLSADGQTV